MAMPQNQVFNLDVDSDLAKLTDPKVESNICFDMRCLPVKFMVDLSKESQIIIRKPPVDTHPNTDIPNIITRFQFNTM